MLFSATEGSVWLKKIADGTRGFDVELKYRSYNREAKESLGFSKLRTLVESQGIERRFVEYLKRKVFVEEKIGNCN